MDSSLDIENVKSVIIEQKISISDNGNSSGKMSCVKVDVSRNGKTKQNIKKYICNDHVQGILVISVV